VILTLVAVTRLTTSSMTSSLGAQTVAVTVPVESASLDTVFARTVTVGLDGVSLVHAIDAVVASAGVHAAYQAQVVGAIRTPVTLHASKLPLGAAFDAILAGTSLRAQAIAPNLIKIESRTSSAPANSGIVTGHVTDKNTSRALRGATVIVDGATKGVSTNDEGQYRITGLAAGEHTLTFKLLGYGRQTQHVKIVDGETATINIALIPSANQLDQVVVTGTVIPTELRAIPNAITIITAKQLEERNITHIDQLFRGDIPGVFAMNTGSQSTLGAVIMFSRGATALTQNSAGTSYNTNPIKTYIDGVEMADPQYLSQIDPRTIERIEVVTGPQASTIYGSNAINGVMQIFTKRGTTPRPQLTLNLQQSWVQNNFNSSLAPGHVLTTQVAGMEGHIGYSLNGSLDYSPRWTPANQMTRFSAGGGGRYEGASPIGRVTVDFSMRRQRTINHDEGDIGQSKTTLQADGELYGNPYAGLKLNYDISLSGESYSFSAGLAPTSWWSQTATIGQDREDTQFLITAPSYSSPADTTLFTGPTENVRRYASYSTTLRVPASSFATLTATLGGDGWQSLSTTSSFSSSSSALSGQNLSGSMTRTPLHNAGAFVESRLGFFEKLYFTYGARAEWNQAYGKDIQPNVVPQYGIAYNLEGGNFTSHFRASYGQTTRPPILKQKRAISFYGEACPSCGNYSHYSSFPAFDSQLGNPSLEPEHQSGYEGGLDLAWSNLLMLSVTRYNQVVDNLIDNVYGIDSVRGTKVDVSGYCNYGPSYCFPDGHAKYVQTQFNNVASLRNQGWELNGTVTTGPLTTNGKYSWTKSRVIGVTERYKTLFPNRIFTAYIPGSTPYGLREHNWLVSTTYARSSLSAILTINGIERAYSQGYDQFALVNFNRRLYLNQSANFDPYFYIGVIPGYTMANLNVARRLGSRADLTLDVQNLTDKYVNDYVANYAEAGRQTSLGLRIRF